MQWECGTVNICQIETILLTLEKDYLNPTLISAGERAEQVSSAC